MQPTLLIGLGGTGAHVIADTLAKLLENPATAEKVGNAIQFLYIDTDTRAPEDIKLPEQSKQGIGFFALPYIEQACQHDENLKKWFDCEIIRRTPFVPEQFDLTRSTAMYRQFGRLALYHDLSAEHHSKVRMSIHRSLLSIQKQTPNPPLVIICTSLIGGTGSAIALDVAYLVRHILVIMNSDAYVLGVFALSHVFASALSHAPEEHHIRFILNQVAAIKEIQHFAQTRYEFGPQGNVIAFDNVEPFDSYWLIGGNHNGQIESRQPTDYFALIASEIGNILASDILSKQSTMLELQSLPFFDERFFYRLERLPKSFDYIHARSPLSTDYIKDWSYWEDVYNRRLKAPQRLCPHVSLEFCK